MRSCETPRAGRRSKRRWIRPFSGARPARCPASLPLFFLEEGDARSAAQQTSCDQEIAADGVFAAAMLTEYRASLEAFGPWFYRRLYWETGVIGQVLYLEAEASGIRAHADSMELRKWAGAPLDGPNRNCYLNEGDVICYVGKPRKLQAVAQVDAPDVGLIAIGDQVRLRFNQNPGETVRGSVAEIGLSDLRMAENQPERGQMVGVRNAVFSDGFSPARYHIRINLEECPAWVRHGSGGVARIVTGRESLAQMIQRFCRRVFRFHL